MPSDIDLLQLIFIEINAFLSIRDDARNRRDYDEADVIRDELK